VTSKSMVQTGARRTGNGVVALAAHVAQPHLDGRDGVLGIRSRINVEPRPVQAGLKRLGCGECHSVVIGLMM